MDAEQPFIATQGTVDSNSKKKKLLKNIFKFLLVSACIVIVFFLLKEVIVKQLSLLPETGTDYEDNWVDVSGDTISGDLIFGNADMELQGNNIITDASIISSIELDILDEGIHVDELIGEVGDVDIDIWENLGDEGYVSEGLLSTTYFDAFANLLDSGRLDNDSDSDLLLRSQADSRFVNESQANSIISSMILDGTISTNDITVGAITNALLANSSVTTGKISDGTILFEDIGQNGCSNNEIMKWNGSAFVCSSDAGTTYSAGNDFDLVGTTFNIESTLNYVSTINPSGDLVFQPDNDTNDYIYFDTTANEEYIYFEDASLGYANDPGFRLNSAGGELEYRDEGVAGWVSFDSLAGGSSLWTDLGSELTPAGGESIQLGNGDWIGVGSGANQPYITFDDVSDYFELMGGSVGIGTTAPGELLDVAYNISLGSGSNADDDYLYFDQEGESLLWDDTADSRFEFSDDVWAESFLTGSTLTLHDDYIRDTGDLNFQPDNDTDDYITLSTGTEVGADTVSAIYWRGIETYTNNPGLSINDDGELVYRDEDAAGWITFDSIAEGAALWTDLGTELTPAGGEDIQLGDGDWIGVGSGANQPYLTFDDASDYFEFMGGSVGIGLTNPGGTLDVLDATSAQLRLSQAALTVHGEFQVDGSGNLIVTTTGSSVTLSGDALSTGGNITSGGDLIISGDDIYDSGTNQIFSFDGSGGIDSLADLTGTGRRSKTIMISPEYAGGTLTTFFGSGTDTSTTGAMTADAEPAADVLRTYYDWKSTESTLNYYTVAVRIRLPQDFDAWEGTDALQIDINTESTSSSNNLVSIYVYNSDDTPGTAVTTSTSNTSDTGDVWKTISIDDSALITGGAPYWDAAGEKGVIYLRMGSKDDTDDGYFARIGDIKLNYLSKW